VDDEGCDVLDVDLVEAASAEVGEQVSLGVRQFDERPAVVCHVNDHSSG